LVSYSSKRPERMAGQNYSLYYIDVWGNKELIHRDKRLSVAYLMPLRKAKRPPKLPEMSPASSPVRYAIASVANVKAGWPDIPAGAVKYLRISQKVPWPCVRDDEKTCGFNDLHWMPAAWEPVLGMWDWGTARVIGVVPVETDGSACFRVPADQTVYFQALDENFLELRRMRSNVTFRAGETRSCVGCHESRAVAPPAGQVPLATLREPSRPLPPPWGDRIVPDYERHIQPIFERHCVRCHGETSPEGGLDFTSRRIDGYLQSYRTLFGLGPAEPTPFAKGYWGIWHPNDPPLSEEANAYARTFLKNVLREPPAGQLVAVADYTGGAEVTQPLAFGSARSRLTLTLLEDPEHRDEVKLSRDEWVSLTTWIDLNAQYWGTFVEKDLHFASRRGGGPLIPPRRVHAVFPDPWSRPPAGEWVWQDSGTVVLKP
ncbi:MAG: HzsA-related protein, partial [Thermoguttaceae bacterium]